jgi:hypothetical protein
MPFLFIVMLTIIMLIVIMLSVVAPLISSYGEWPSKKSFTTLTPGGQSDW